MPKNAGKKPAKYVIVRNHLLDLVRNGLANGSPVPSERELCEQFEVSRMTVRQAIDTLVVDGVDGTLARRARVSEIIPWFDGGIVDIVVDYLTWTFIPAVFMYVALPMGPRPLAGLLMALVLSSSMFCYANKQWKSTDYYFVGFPAAWNIVALMFYVLQTPGVFNIIVTLIFVVLTLVPTHYAHPARVKRFRALNIGAVAVWFLATCWLVAIYPHRPLSLVAVLIVSGGWFLLAGVLRSIRGEESTAAAA